MQLDTHPVIDEVRALVANVVHRSADSDVLICTNIARLWRNPRTLESSAGLGCLSSQPRCDPVIEGWEAVPLTLGTLLGLAVTQVSLLFRLIAGKYAAQRVEYITEQPDPSCTGRSRGKNRSPLRTLALEQPFELDLVSCA